MTSSKNPPPAAKSSVYARFIPREEVSSFAAWNPGARCACRSAKQGCLSMPARQSWAR